MNYNSVIKPDAMISQCNEMLLMFEQDNDSIQTVWNAFHQFIGESEIESEAFHALKQRVSDYLTVLQSMKIANEMDMEDCRNFARLMEAVGINIIGSDVLDGEEAAKQDMLDHDTLADKNASKAKHTSKPLKWYYECQKKYYEMLAENDEDIYNEWRRMEETYDEIDAASANYFIRGNQVRTMAASALQELKQLSIDNSSTPMSSAYRNTLQGICTTYEDTFDKGNISEKEKYQIKSWIETDYKLSDEELEVAKEYIDKYFKENKQANKLLNSKTATAAAVIRNQMSVEEFKEYQMMVALYNKTSKWNGFWLGVIDAIPFLTEVIDWSDSMVCEMEEKQTVKNATLSSIMENVRCQNPFAYGSGYAASLAAQTAAINALLESGEGAEIAKSAEGLERAETAETVKGLEEGLAAGGGTNTTWYNSDGSINYPPNNGAVPGTEVNMTLKPGDILGRYGNIGQKSNFVTQAGADATKLALPPNTDFTIYQEFEVVKNIPGTIQAEIAPWGGSVGGGLQYELPKPILQLIREGYIVPK